MTALASASDGSIVERYTYDQFGDRTILEPNGSTVQNVSNYDMPYGYTNRRHENDSGLMYFRARFYDPTTGEFTSRDPLEYVDGMSLTRPYLSLFLVDSRGKSVEDVPPTFTVHDYYNVLEKTDRAASYFFIGSYSGTAGKAILAKLTYRASYKIKEVELKDGAATHFCEIGEDSQYYAEWFRLLSPGSEEQLKLVKETQERDGINSLIDITQIMSRDAHRYNRSGVHYCALDMSAEIEFGYVDESLLPNVRFGYANRPKWKDGSRVFGGWFHRIRTVKTTDGLDFSGQSYVWSFQYKFRSDDELCREYCCETADADAIVWKGVITGGGGGHVLD